jgi:hypothetical protein
VNACAPGSSRELPGSAPGLPPAAGYTRPTVEVVTDTHFCEEGSTMNRVLMPLMVLLLVVVARADDPAPAPVKVRGSLPPLYKKLGLSAAQVQEVYKIRATTRAKVDVLQAQIEQLRRQEKVDLDKVLTGAQRNLLRELRAGPVPQTPPVAVPDANKATSGKK